MPKVLTHCPRTHEVVPTNLSMDFATFATIRFGGFSFACPACSDQHVWRQEDAWVAGAGPERATPAVAVAHP